MSREDELVNGDDFKKWLNTPLLVCIEQAEWVASEQGLLLRLLLDAVRQEDVRSNDHTIPCSALRDLDTALISMTFSLESAQRLPCGIDPRTAFSPYECEGKCFNVTITDGKVPEPDSRCQASKVELYYPPSRTTPSCMPEDISLHLVIAGDRRITPPLEAVHNFSELTRLHRGDTDNREIKGIDVVNVGQGNMNILVNDLDAPVCYFDLGAGFGPNHHTRPHTIPTDLAPGVPVVLSHWDIDHWILGNEIPTAMNRMWFAPLQNCGPTTCKFLDKLHSTGNLVLLEGEPARWLNLGRVDLAFADGPTKNDSGLLLRVPLRSGKKLLCPGDASIWAIPDIGSTSWGGLVVPHHGSRHSVGTPPKPWRPGCIAAISYGQENTYRHPAPEVFDSYAKNGWNVSGTVGTTKIRIPGRTRLTTMRVSTRTLKAPGSK